MVTSPQSITWKVVRFEHVHKLADSWERSKWGSGGTPPEKFEKKRTIWCILVHFRDNNLFRAPLNTCPISLCVLTPILFCLFFIYTSRTSPHFFSRNHRSSNYLKSYIHYIYTEYHHQPELYLEQVKIAKPKTLKKKMCNKHNMDTFFICDHNSIFQSMYFESLADQHELSRRDSCSFNNIWWHPPRL